jgi:hypothetical protein
MKNLYDTYGVLLTKSGDVIPNHKVDEWFSENSFRFVTKDQQFVKVEFSERGDTLWLVYKNLREDCWECESAGNTEGWCEGHGDNGIWEMIDFTRVNVWN